MGFFRAFFILIFSSFLLMGCAKSFQSQILLNPNLIDNQSSSSAPELPDVPAIPISYTDAKPLWETAKVTNGAVWTAHVMKNLSTLGADLLNAAPADADLFCPNYSRLSQDERKIFWTFFISSMVKFESGFNTNSSYQESFNDSNGNPVISRGLLQISIESGNAYGCAFAQASDLHDPLKNLSCGIRILNRWLKADGRFAGYVDTKWRGGARYWSVLREGDKTSYKSIVSWSQNLAMCK